MKLPSKSVAGTLESSDVLVELEPSDSVVVQIQSLVKKQFGASIEASVREELKRLGVDGAIVRINDHGALDCTIRARLETAVRRAMKGDVR